MTSMYDSLFSRLQDNVPPVREAAAIALSCIVSAHGMNDRHIAAIVNFLNVVCNLLLKFSCHLEGLTVSVEQCKGLGY